MKGVSTSLGASRRVSLRVGGSTEAREGLKSGCKAEAGEDENGGSSSVDMGDWGVRVSLARLSSCFPPQEGDGNQPYLPPSPSAGTFQKQVPPDLSATRRPRHALT